jgi:hypothetical protein
MHTNFICVISLHRSKEDKFSLQGACNLKDVTAYLKASTRLEDKLACYNNCMFILISRLHNPLVDSTVPMQSDV